MVHCGSRWLCVSIFSEFPRRKSMKRNAWKKHRKTWGRVGKTAKKQKKPSMGVHSSITPWPCAEVLKEDTIFANFGGFTPTISGNIGLVDYWCYAVLPYHDISLPASAHIRRDQRNGNSLGPAYKCGGICPTVGSSMLLLLLLLLLLR